MQEPKNEKEKKINKKMLPRLPPSRTGEQNKNVKEIIPHDSQKSK
jgi:hypothetical protein